MSVRLLSIVLPVYNQADHLAEVVADYRAELARVPCPFELILVPNGSRDASEAICRALARQYDDVRCEPSAATGWGAAVRHGLAVARGDLLGYTNLARTSAQDLTLIAIYSYSYPDVVVKANRKIRDGFRRRLGSLLYNLECRALFDLSYWDINGTPKVFPRSFDRLAHLARSDDLIDLEFNVACRRQSYPVVEVPIFSVRRHGGRSTTNIRSALRMYLGALRMRRAMGPTV